MEINDLTFGIEIECLIPAAAGIRVGSYSCGVPLDAHPEWSVKHDASLYSRSYQYYGAEIVSPILRGAEGLEKVRTVVAYLNSIGAKVNPSCGFHVHVGLASGATMPIPALRRLVCFVAHHELGFFASTGSQNRAINRYCASIKVSHRPFERLRSIDDAVVGASRYHVLNLTNLRRTRTIEFRAFAGTTNITKIEAYIGLCLGSVIKAYRGKKVAWDAPAINKNQIRQRLGNGEQAVRRLMYQLGWHKAKPSNALGIFDPARVPALVDKMREMGRKFDGVGAHQ